MSGDRPNQRRSSLERYRPRQRPSIEDNDLRHHLNRLRLEPQEQPREHHEDHRERHQEHHEDHQERRQERPKEHEDLRYKLNNNHNNNRRRKQKKGQGPSNGIKGPLPLVKRNTETFEPSYSSPEMRILCSFPGWTLYSRPYSTRDVVIVNDLFGSSDDMTIYKALLHEIEESGVALDRLWQSWHGDSHVIADDKMNWKDKCPTFNSVIEKVANYFKMDVKATRLNWYRDSSEWKPFHHDAAAVKPHMARTQNFTAAVSFGAERDAAFEHAKTKTVISMPQPNGTVYTFGRDVNIIWRHGIPQLPPEKIIDEGRISIILWGWIDQFEI